jgi:hypothetical protein
MEFRKSLARYYKLWYQNCLDSAEYCKEQPDIAGDYLKRAREYKELIDKNSKAIEFFSVGDRAFLIDSALPKEFRGYK